MAERIMAPIGTFPPWARAVARSLIDIEDAQTTSIVLLHVERTADSIPAESVDDQVRSHPSVQAATEILTDAGFDVTVEGQQNSELADTILGSIKTLVIDRLYMHARRRSPTGKAVYGSTVQQVLTNATVPVVVVPSSAITVAD
jgi:nucleotide-binding universal stress UspA family protein